MTEVVTVTEYLVVAQESTPSAFEVIIGGPVGPAGPQGATGAQGPQGIQGVAGATGATGPAGADGKTLLNGMVDPTAGIGVDGDFYTNTATSTFFGPKAAGAWPAGVSIVGPAGATGATGPTGPTGATGATGPAGTPIADTDALTEGATNQYFTVARVRAALLTGLSVATSQVVAATDSVLQAIGYLQAQITAYKDAAITFTNKTLANPVINGFTGDTSAINIGSGQLVKEAGGNVGIGKTPVSKLDVSGSAYAGADTNVAAYLYSSGTEARIGVGGRSTVTNVPLTIWMANGGSNFETARFGTDGSFTLSTPAGLGYGIGAGSTATQPTSKATAVTLNKPTGKIILNGASLAAGATVGFQLNSSSIAAGDTVSINIFSATATLGAYRIWVDRVETGYTYVYIQNYSGGDLAEAFSLQFNVHKGAAA